MSRMRAITILAAFAGLTVPLMPVQALLLKVAPARARRLPHWYHRQVCRLLGVRLATSGSICPGPVLVVANHTSWLDIPVLSAVAPVSFVAKSEVGTWPFVRTLARLQRTVFVDRQRRQNTGETAGEIAARLASGDALVLFPEGTSSDGNRVLPFRSALFGAVVAPVRGAGASVLVGTGQAPVVQTVTLAYTRRHGLPVTRADRPSIGWYGDMELGSHAWQLLKAGPLDVEIRISPPVRLDGYASRKELALATEATVREALARLLLRRAEEEPVAVVMPQGEARSAGPTARRDASGSRRNFT